MAVTYQKVSAQTAASALDGTEVVSLVQNGNTRRSTSKAVANTADTLGDVATGTMRPSTDAVGTLGTTSYRYAGAYLKSTGLLDFGSGDVTVTHSSAALTVSGALKSSLATGGIGYATGAGGTVTQATSRTTGVTINKVCGSITLVSAAGSTTPATFTVTNSTVAATDTVVVCQKSGTDLYDLSVSAVAAGSFNITFNTKSGTTTEQPVFNFAVIKAVTA